MTEDLCEKLEVTTGYFGSVEKCNNFTYGIANQGMNLVLMNYIRIMRQQLYRSQLNFNNQTYLNTFQNEE